VNPHAAVSISPIALIGSLTKNWQLIVEMAKREVVGRYKGSVMGLLWSFLNPLFMLAVYTFVFSVVFKARWTGTGDESRSEFAVILFAGMIVHSLFAEVLNRAPNLIISNANYVKKVIFPLEILPMVTLGAALFHAFVSLIVLTVAQLVIGGHVAWTIVFVPVIFIPLSILTLGLAWFLASLGVFLRDVGQTVGILMTVMLFLSPVFFPVTALPEKLRPFIMVNPLTFIIEQCRAVAIWGRYPDWTGLAAYTAMALVVAWLGYAWFQKTRRGFADVL
jgi:lipopolysaccharide transport system permease protein